MTRASCIERLASAIAAAHLNHPTRVAIDGVDGVGKTKLADELVEPLATRGREVIRASVDGFHRPRTVRYRRGRDSAEGYFLDSFDYASLRHELLEPLGPGGSRRFRTAVFDHRRDQPVDLGHGQAARDAILLLDGVFLQRTELAGACDFRIWVEAPFEVTVSRAVARDVQEQGERDAIQALYERRYVPGQLIYLTQCSPRESADVVVHNSNLENPDLMFRQTV